MSYAPQVPWLQQATIRSNIVCCEPWDAVRYNAVLHACALEMDLKNMPLSDETPIAEKGISLSGGQKQRVALARAAYRVADIYVLDNPISALDDQTQEHIWKHLIEGLLQHATVIIGSSRPVISCTAVLHLTPEGLKPCDPQFYNGWCSDSARRTDPPPPRYATTRSNYLSDSNAAFARQSASDAQFQQSGIKSEVSTPPPLRLESAAAATTRGRHGALSNLTIEQASVCDVEEQAAKFERFSDAAMKSETETNADSKNVVSRILLQPQVSFGSVKGSFMDELAQEKLAKSRRFSTTNASFKSLLAPVAQEENISLKIAIEAPPQPRSKSAAAINNEAYTPSASQAGFVQWIRACDVTFSLALALSLAYILNQFGRSYYSLWAAWWNGRFFGISSVNYNYGLIGLFGSQVVFRVRVGLRL